MSWPAFLQAARAGNHFSFMFIDGSHKIHHVTEDLAWTRLLDPGGIVCFHDYSEKFPGVTHAVDRFLARYSRGYRVVEQVETLLIVEKLAASTTKEISSWDRVRARIVNIAHQLQASAKKRMARSAPS